MLLHAACNAADAAAEADARSTSTWVMTYWQGFGRAPAGRAQSGARSTRA